MKKNEIKIGGVYSTKITDRVVPVRIEKANPAGGWDATNLNTKRKVHIKSAAKLRGKVANPPNGDTATTSPTSAKGEIKATTEAKAAEVATGANTAATDPKGEVKANQEAKGPKDATPPKSRGDAKPKKRLGILDVAVQILANATDPMGCKDIVEKAIAEGLWSTKGKTPHATLYAAITREIQAKGDDTRFEKVERGRFRARLRKAGA